MTELDPTTRVIVIRRGEKMRVVYPMTQYGLDTTSAPELALAAMIILMELQMQYPGRADLPITSATPQVALALPFADDVLNDDEPLWAILAGHWQPYHLDVVGAVEDYMKTYPCVVLNLVDLNPGA